MAGRLAEDGLPEEVDAKEFSAKAKAYDKLQRKHHWIYSCQVSSYYLFRTHLTTGHRERIVLRYERFRQSELCMLPYGKLSFTGGHANTGEKPYGNVYCIDTLKDFALTGKPDMLTPRRKHAAIYFDNYIYVIGGLVMASSNNRLKECERFEVHQEQWEPLENLPHYSTGSASVVVSGETRCLYTLGSHTSNDVTDLIQRLSLTELKWDILELKLPQPRWVIASFKLDESQFYFIMERTLYSFNPQDSSVHTVKTLSEYMVNVGPSIYSKGSLYISNFDTYVFKEEILGIV